MPTRGGWLPACSLESWELQRIPSWTKLGSVYLQIAMAVRLIATGGPRLLPWGLLHED